MTGSSEPVLMLRAPSAYWVSSNLATKVIGIVGLKHEQKLSSEEASTTVGAEHGVLQKYATKGLEAGPATSSSEIIHAKTPSIA